jgi:pimeloyl-ACP methyl ester carboxylesterase
MATPRRFAGRSVVLPGRGTTFVREAEGPSGAPTLFLLHGLAATGGLNWGASFEALSDSFAFVALDHRGHGRGITSRSPFRLADCADDVAALADALGIDRFIAVGYSMGGPIAQLLWHRHRDRLAGLVLCATACTLTPTSQRRGAWALSPMLNFAGRLAPRRAARQLARRWLDRAIVDDAMRARIADELDGSDPVMVAQAVAAVARFDSSDWIRHIDRPTAVVVTERDRLVSPKQQLRMAHAIPGASIHLVAGDHLVCVNRPRLFVPALLEGCRAVAKAEPAGSAASPRARPA